MIPVFVEQFGIVAIALQVQRRWILLQLSIDGVKAGTPLTLLVNRMFEPGCELEARCTVFKTMKSSPVAPSVYALRVHRWEEGAVQPMRTDDDVPRFEEAAE